MLLDFITLENTKEAMYLQLYEKIADMALNGNIKAGEKLPSIREAAAQLGVSCTTVENAYIKLCIEGIAESSPQRGYYICSIKKGVNLPEKPAEKTFLYDFSGRKIDIAAADTSFWQKTVREVLRDTDALISYGDPQGEHTLREELSQYSYKARGVKTNPQNIVIGAGIGPLLNILCGLIGRDNTVATEGIGFKQAEQIFEDYGINTIPLENDENGAMPHSLYKSGANILFLTPSALSKISISGIIARRNAFSKWVSEAPERLIIEDDYNGELRYTARAVNAFQGKDRENTVYIGSFSKLLLPSVRIAYMVLPDRLLEKFNRRKRLYNQTCGKTEQIALKKYIESGELEKHLRKLRKLYYNKSKYFLSSVIEVFPTAEITLYESSITAEVDFKINTDSVKLCEILQAAEIRVLPTEKRGAVRMCFAGIEENNILPALRLIKTTFIDSKLV